MVSMFHGFTVGIPAPSAVAMDIDAAGLPFLKNLDPPAGSKKVSELCDIIQMAGTPFIVKGIMTVKGALKAKEAGASAIIVSNHGGRVLDQCPATAEVLESIVKALEGSGNDSRYASAINVVTTLCAVVTMPVMVLLYEEFI